VNIETFLKRWGIHFADYLSTITGYGASTEGTWPYSYDSCDVGILPNQTYINGTGPYDALHSPQDGTLSYLPGQRWSSCTCQGEDHPGPDVSVGRGVPEVDLIEAQVVIDSQRGQVSQTLQLAPYDSNWQFNQNYSEVYDSDNTYWNTYTGGTGQQSASGLTYVGNDVYTETGARSAVYSYEMYANKDDRENGYITWMADGKKAWTLHADGLAANSGTEVGRRLIPEEPMSLVFNFGMSDSISAIYSCCWKLNMSICSNRNVEQFPAGRFHSPQFPKRNVVRIRKDLST
jgi:beta-glucanase (GH16 family)